MNSYANPSHEEAVAEAVKRAAPDRFLTVGSEVSREWGEYERTSTAVLNAYTMPKLTRYLDKLECTFRDGGFPGTPLTMLSNGGTSIAWIDGIGNVRVGPTAAGALPGPACYGKGGTDPTVTDAYVVTGLLNQKYLLGGDLKIDRSLSEKALRPLADRFHASVAAFAEGVVKLANDNAADALRLVSVQRGYDPREFALIAYGGSGPMFAPFIARELEIGTIVVPSVPPGVFSAWGMLVTDVKHDLVLTQTLLLDVE